MCVRSLSDEWILSAGPAMRMQQMLRGQRLPPIPHLLSVMVQPKQVCHGLGRSHQVQRILLCVILGLVENVATQCVCLTLQPRKYPEEERDLMREDEIASLPTETERRREVVLTTVSALMPSIHDLSSQLCSRA